MNHAVKRLVPVAIPLVLIAVIGVIVLPTHYRSAGVTPIRDSQVSCAPQVRLSPPYVGVASGQPTAKAISTFTDATGVRPSVIEFYIGFGHPFSLRQACQITRGGALPLIQLNSNSYSLAGIAAGRDDGYLRQYAKAVASFGLPVALSFDHEMNGNWYRWGYQHVSPAVYIAAWRHLHDVFVHVGARNVIWVWTVNTNSARAGTISPDRLWWPGGNYVTWIGINGKYATPASNFASIFGASVASVRELAAKPVLLTETGIAAGPQRPGQIRNLFAGMVAYSQIIGMVWFNLKATHGDWRLQGDPASDAVFRREARNYM